MPNCQRSQIRFGLKLYDWLHQCFLSLKQYFWITGYAKSQSPEQQLAQMERIVVARNGSWAAGWNEVQLSSWQLLHIGLQVRIHKHPVLTQEQCSRATKLNVLLWFIWTYDSDKPEMPWRPSVHIFDTRAPYRDTNSFAVRGSFSFIKFSWD